MIGIATPASPSPAPRVRFGIGVHSALTARIAERAGFDLLWVSAAEVAARLGLARPRPVTAAQLAAVTAQIHAVCEAPVCADAGDDSANPVLAVSTARLFERSGAAAICLHDAPDRTVDAVLPPRLEGTRPFSELLTAVAGNRGAMRLIACTWAPVAGTPADEAAARLRAYREAGADGFLIRFGRGSRDLLEPVLASVRGAQPLVVVPSDVPNVSVEDLARIGVTDLLFPDVVAATIRASLPEMLRTVRGTGRLADIVDRIATVEEVFDLMTQG